MTISLLSLRSGRQWSLPPYTALPEQVECSRIESVQCSNWPSRRRGRSTDATRRAGDQERPRVASPRVAKGAARPGVDLPERYDRVVAASLEFPDVDRMEPSS